jgi:hypothetical protein
MGEAGHVEGRKYSRDVYSSLVETSGRMLRIMGEQRLCFTLLVCVCVCVCARARVNARVSNSLTKSIQTDAFNFRTLEGGP